MPREVGSRGQGWPFFNMCQSFDALGSKVRWGTGALQACPTRPFKGS